MFNSVKFIVCILLGHFIVNTDARVWNAITKTANKLKETITNVHQWGTIKVDQFVAGLSFNKHAPYNIVLIGQTGSGKTALLNLLLNINNIVDLKNSQQTIRNLRLYNNIALELVTDDNTMSSKTADCQEYPTKFGDYVMKIVDTPGFGDSRGFEFDVNHTKNIITAIKNLNYVHCIILVINGREARMTATLKYVLEQIFVIMPSTVQNNIVVVFTNVDDIFNLNFKIGSLSEYVRTDVKHYWLIENPICKLQKLKKNDDKRQLNQELVFEDDIVDSLERSFEQTTKTITDMYKTISSFTPVHSNEFQTLYNLKESIEQKYLELTIKHQELIKDNKRITDFHDQILLYKDRKVKYMDFNKSEIVEKTSLEPTTEHNTLCAHEGCFHNCHLDCYLPLTLERGSEIFKGCVAMDLTGLTCKVCGHSYKDHYHVKSKWITTREIKYYIDDASLASFNQAKTDEERAQIALQSTVIQLDMIKQNIKELQNELFELLKKYEEIGLRKNYLALLQSQLNYATMTLKNYHGSHNDDIYKGLVTWKDQLQLKINFSKTNHAEL